MLLARWTEFARSAVALPTTGDGALWRDSVADIIGLQATALALKDLDEHELEQGRALAIDTASVGIDRHAQNLADVWDDEPWPPELHELLDDARRALADAGASGLEWSIDDGPASLEHPAELAGVLEAMRFGGDLYLASPGALLSEGCPCAFVHQPGGTIADESVIEAVGAFLEAHGLAGHWTRRGPPRQVYRQFDFAAGGPVRDVVAWLYGDPRSGQPLLVPVVIDGETQPVALPLRRGPVPEPPPLEFEAEDQASDRSVD